MMQPNKIKGTDLAYVAGIIDGEGCIAIHRTGRQELKARVMVVNTNEWLLQWLKFQFGGSIYPRSQENDKWKDSWTWEIVTKQAIDFLKLVLPYLKIKRPQAELLIEFQKGRHSNFSRRSEKEKVLQEAQAILMHKYNKKGPTGGP